MSPSGVTEWRSGVQHVRPEPNELSAAGGFPAKSGGGRGVVDLDGTGMGEPGCAARSAARPAALPCQNKNNCTNSTGSLYRLKTRQVVVRPDGSECYFWQPQPTDHLGRAWSENKDGVLENVFFECSAAERKAAFQLRQNVAAFVAHWGRSHCAFFTLTDTAGIRPKEFARRWHSFATHEGEWLQAYVRVLEPQRNKRPHYHFLVATSWDMQPDAFDWPSFFLAQEQAPRAGKGPGPQFAEARRRYVESAPLEVRAMWKRLRVMLPKYRLGRAEFLPIRKGAEALSEYVGKYLEAGLALRVHGWKGARRTECDRRTSEAWKRCARLFSWVSPGAKHWRQRVGQLAAALGVLPNDFATLKSLLGKHWAYYLRGAIISAPDTEWAEAIALLREKFDREAL